MWSYYLRGKVEVEVYLPHRFFENGQAMIAAEREIGRRRTTPASVPFPSIAWLFPKERQAPVAASDPAGAHRAPGGVTTSPSG